MLEYLVVLVHDGHDPAAVGGAPFVLILVLKVDVELSDLKICSGSTRAGFLDAIVLSETFLTQSELIIKPALPEVA